MHGRDVLDEDFRPAQDGENGVRRIGLVTRPALKVEIIVLAVLPGKDEIVGRIVIPERPLLNRRNVLQRPGRRLARGSISTPRAYSSAD